MEAAVLTGGTHVHVAVRDGGTERLRRTLPTAAPEQTLASITALLAPLEPTTLGLATFGPVDLDPASATYGHLGTTPKEGWDGFPLGPRLAKGLGVRRWAVDTDVNAAARAEAGAGGEQSLAYVTVGTGVGVGWIRDGWTPRTPDHPEAGHLPGDPADPFAGACVFHGACVEGLASGRALQVRTGCNPVALADDDPVWQWVARHLGRLVHTIMLLNPVQRVVIGGGVLAARPFLYDALVTHAAQLAGIYRPLARGLVSPPRMPRPDLEGAFLLAHGARAW